MKDKIEFIKKIIFSEIFMYLVMGFLTTVVNVVSFKILVDIFNKNGTASGMGWKLAEVISFVIAVIFAFITNKIFVFKSYSIDFKILGKELGSFTGARIITEFINMLIMWIMIDNMHIGTLITKIVASVIVIVLNYIFSKFFIFKKHAA